MLDDLWNKSDRYRRIGLELPPGEEPRTREHHELLDLIVAGDAAARSRMRAHIERSLTGSALDALEYWERRGFAEAESEASYGKSLSVCRG
ncbi:hypothetical protein GCM10011581_29920 [Saccharopolyspora subtropica]|uniref:GntR C-terminal domain-containing protein n=1 Tax=Saccharopolyspora thermophila TaxID=89367 RepID=A0A917JYX3_9PSEU|nr:hypothetical protein GCM10011581_29920 [Saccharopolyspora subtropica]